MKPVSPSPVRAPSAGLRRRVGRNFPKTFRSTLKVLHILIFSVFLSTPVLAAEPGLPDPQATPHPEAFRGLGFGISLDEARRQVPELKPVSELMPAEDSRFEDVYFRPDEQLTFGAADILSVAYVFRDDRLTSVVLTLNGDRNVFLVKDLLIQDYGPGRQAGLHYGWTWPDFSVVLSGHPEGGLSSLTYTLER